MAAVRTGGCHLVVVLTPPAAALALNLYLAWAYKDPDYVLVSTLGASLAFGILTPPVLSAARARPA